MASTENLPHGYTRDGSVAVKWELAYSPAERTAVLIRSVYAGVSGPDAETSGLDSEEAAIAWAFGHGLIVTADGFTTAADGTRWALLASFKG